AAGQKRPPLGLGAAEVTERKVLVPEPPQRPQHGLHGAVGLPAPHAVPSARKLADRTAAAARAAHREHGRRTESCSAAAGPATGAYLPVLRRERATADHAHLVGHRSGLIKKCHPVEIARPLRRYYEA